jgi:hypothetical protein
MNKVVFFPSAAQTWELPLLRNYEALAPNPSKKRGFDSRLVLNETAMMAEWKTISANFPRVEAVLIVCGVSNKGQETVLHVYRIESSVYAWVKTNRRALFEQVLSHLKTQHFKAIRFQVAYPKLLAA